MWFQTLSGLDSTCLPSRRMAPAGPQILCAVLLPMSFSTPSGTRASMNADDATWEQFGRTDPLCRRESMDDKARKQFSASGEAQADYLTCWPCSSIPQGPQGRGGGHVVVDARRPCAPWSILAPGEGSVIQFPYAQRRHAAGTGLPTRPRAWAIALGHACTDIRRRLSVRTPRMQMSAYPIEQLMFFLQTEA